MLTSYLLKVKTVAPFYSDFIVWDLDFSFLEFCWRGIHWTLINHKNCDCSPHSQPLWYHNSSVSDWSLQVRLTSIVYGKKSSNNEWVSESFSECVSDMTLIELSMAVTRTTKYLINLWSANANSDWGKRTKRKEDSPQPRPPPLQQVLISCNRNPVEDCLPLSWY